MILDRPNSSRVRKPQFLCIVGCEGKNQERMYLEKIAQLVNCVEERSRDLVFDFAEPYGGTPKCVVERTLKKSIGKENKASIFDYDGKKVKYEEAIDLAKENKIELGYSNYSFDLWLLLHKEDYFAVVPNQKEYEDELRRVYGLPAEESIKRGRKVERILEQIEWPDIKTAIERAEKIAIDNEGRQENITAGNNIYYDNPDTQMHVLLKFLFKKVGVNIETLG